MNINLRATFDEVSYPDPESEDYEEELGWCDPSNPWGGIDSADEPIPYVAESLSDAVHFVVDFPGGVWDYREGEAEQDYRTGVYRRVTLHVPEEHAERVFRWVSIIERIQDERLRNIYPMIGR